MSDAESTPAASPKPADGNDPQDPLRPEIEEENNEDNTPPLAEPTQDPDATEEQEHATENPLDDNGNQDDDSDLSDIDEATFDDFDTAALDIEERPVAIDETNVNLLGSHKRKRVEGEDGGEKKKKKKRRDGRKSRRVLDDDEIGDAGAAEPTLKSKSRGKGRSAQPAPAQDWSNLTPQQREIKELEKRLDDAVRRKPRSNPGPSSIEKDTKFEEDLENMAQRMTNAAETDAADHRAGKPAVAKLALLPEVLTLMSRRTHRHVLLEPDNGFLEAVRFFLEPLEPDGALPAYNVQRQVIANLARLPLEREILSATGLGKVMLFYTKSKKPEMEIKRAAERLIGDWSRPIMEKNARTKKTDGAGTAPQAVAAARANPRQDRPKVRASQNGPASHRAVVDRTLPSYTIAPKSNVIVQSTGRPSTDSFARLKARQQAASRS